MISRLSGVVETITDFFGQLVESGYLSLDYIFYIGLALQLVLVVFFIIKSSYSYELRLDRALDGLNRWLYYNQYIDESNLIEFNQKMKRVPKLLRYHWQQYMLYRDKEPSNYMSAYNCIEKPLHTSSFTSNIKNLMSICYTLMAVTFVLNLASYALIWQTNLAYILINSLLTPMFILLLATFFSILLRSWQNSNLAGLYQNFHLFTRYIDKACSTLPAYIDFEVLFTKEEIKRGIPVLNEYLEKRARQEQKELEEAMLNTIDHEVFDFESVGLDGSQILERAMKETEIYLNQRQRAMAEIQQLESEIESAKRNYENNQKEYQRKMQASKENIDRLRKQQEESTNRIESNYIRKQQADEIKKQEQLEKDYETITLRFNQEIASIEAEIKTRKAELEERRKAVEEAMKSEFETFSTKTYNTINQKIVEREKQEKEALSEERDYYAQSLEHSKLIIAEKDKEISRLYKILDEHGINHGEFFDENLRKEAEKVKFGNLSVKKEVKEENEEQPKVETNLAEEKQVEQPQPTEEEPVYDEYGGYYDSEGYYRYKNGTYYDPEGNFFDEFGGYYDKDGNYHPPKQENNEDSPKQPELEDQPKKSPTSYFADNDDDIFIGGKAPSLDTSKMPKFVEYEVEFDKPEKFSNDDDIFIKPTEKSIKPAYADFEDDEVKFEPIIRQNEKPSATPTQTYQDDEVKFEPIIRQNEKPSATPQVEPVEEQVEDEYEETEEQEKTEQALKGKRGRPRKEVLEEPKPKGKRGRPRKEILEEPKPKGKRGRPRKEILEEPKPKGKRGRPRKFGTNDEKDDSSQLTSLEDSSQILDELELLNKQIEEENEKLKATQDELATKIDETLLSFDDEADDYDDDESGRA